MRERATKVALNTRFFGVALETAGIWLAADPESQEARQTLAWLLINQSRLADAQPHLEKWLAADKDNVGASFMQLNALLARHPDKAAVLQLTQNLAKPYPAVPEARYSIAQAAWAAGQAPLALARNPRGAQAAPGLGAGGAFPGPGAAAHVERRSARLLRDLPEDLSARDGSAVELRAAPGDRQEIRRRARASFRRCSGSFRTMRMSRWR